MRQAVPWVAVLSHPKVSEGKSPRWENQAQLDQELTKKGKYPTWCRVYKKGTWLYVKLSHMSAFSSLAVIQSLYFKKGKKKSGGGSYQCDTEHKDMSQPAALMISHSAMSKCASMQGAVEMEREQRQQGRNHTKVEGCKCRNHYGWRWEKRTHITILHLWMNSNLRHTPVCALVETQHKKETHLQQPLLTTQE